MSLRILHVLPKLDTGGVETSTVRLARMQKQLGHEPIVVSAGGVLVDQLMEAHIEHILAPLQTKNPLKILANAISLKKLFFDKKCDLVHVHSRAPAWSAYLALRGTSLPWVSTFHGVYGHKNRAKRFYNQTMLRGHGVITPSHYVKTHIKTAYKCIIDPVVIYPGIDLDFFSTRHFAEDCIHKKRELWGIKPGEKALLLPGRLSRIKGHKVAIEALKRLKNHPIKLIIIGEGSPTYIKELQQIARPIRDNIVFLPAENDLRLNYVASDVVLNTTLKPESFGLTVLEALALRKPVIVTNLGGPAEIVQGGALGKVIPANNPDALATAILETLEQPKKVDTRSLQKFGQEYCAQQVIHLYKSCVFNRS